MNQHDLIPSGGLIPIGKNKGKPLEVLLNDQEEIQWWRAHPSVAKKYPFVIQFINNFDDSAPTPVHNLLQIKFLDETLRRKTYSLFAQERTLRDSKTFWDKYLCGQVEPGDFLFNRFVEVGPPKFEQSGGVDVQFCGNFYFQICSSKQIPGFTESKGDDELSLTYPYRLIFYGETELRAELKPLLGDDYPAIFRKMHGKKRNCLIYDVYDGCISLDELKAFFATGNIVVLQKSEIEDACLPAQRRQILF